MLFLSWLWSTGPVHTMQNLVCFAKKSVNRKPFLVRIIFPTTKIFSTATKLQRCHWEHLEAYNFLPGNKILWFLTAILRRVILFCEHDQRGKSYKNKKMVITKFPNFLQAWVWTGPKSEFTHLSMLCPLPYYTSPAPLWRGALAL